MSEAATTAPAQTTGQQDAATTSSEPKRIDTVAQAVSELDRRAAERRAERDAARNARRADKEERRAEREARQSSADDRLRALERQRDAEADADADEADDDTGDEEDTRRPDRKAKDKTKETKAARRPDGDDEADDDGQADEDSEGSDPDLQASADDDLDDDERDAATDEDDEGEDTDTTVDIDGKTLEIPKGTPKAVREAVTKLASDLKSDYTRKTTEVAQVREALGQRAQATEQLLGQVQRAQQVVLQMAQQMIGEPPPLALAQTDIQSYTVQKALYEQRVAAFQQMTQQGRELAEAQQRQQAATSRQALLEEAQKMVKTLPQLADPAKKKAFFDRAIKAAEKSGFTEQDVASVSDSRMLHLLHRLMTAEAKLAAIERAEGTVAQKLKNVPPRTLKGGTSLSTTDTKRLGSKKAMQSFLKSSRTMRDVRAALAAMPD